MKFKSTIFEEPQLEFGDKFQDPDPRRGLFMAGPLQTPVGDAIKIAVVGSAKTVEDTGKFLDAAAQGIAGKRKSIRTCTRTFLGLAIAILIDAGSKLLQMPARQYLKLA